ncbi:uncharacterized protein [Antennarius striatus]|uniref:uncharacterized protein n=1 Tax=Antennarius striatus TaxID=241820 RepID=UPI0035AFEAAB
MQYVAHSSSLLLLGYDSAPHLLHLLLLAELFVRSSSCPISARSLCGAFRLMLPHLDRLNTFSKELHDLTDDELVYFEAVENTLDHLPLIRHNATSFRALKVNATLAQLYVYTHSFTIHVDWLRDARENLSLASSPAEGAGNHLLQLSGLLNASLHQIMEAVPRTATPPLPPITTAFEAQLYSFQVSERLRVFCDWSRRVLHHLQRRSCCPRR